MAKVAFKSQEEADDFIKATKAELEAAKEEFTTFRKDNKIAKDTKPEDAKLLKRYEKMTDLIEKKRASITEAKDWKSANKVKKERAAKYAYPAGMSSDEKKKFRTKMRAEAKKKEKEANGGTSTKKKKKEEAKAEAAAPAKKSKSEKKAEKKAAAKAEAVTTED